MYNGEQEGMIRRLGIRGHRIDEIAMTNALSALERAADFVEYASGGMGEGKRRSKRNAAKDRVRADIFVHNNAHDAFDNAVRAKDRMNDGKELYMRNPLVAADAATRGEDVENYVHEAAVKTEVNLEGAKDKISSTNEALRPYGLAQEHTFVS